MWVSLIVYFILFSWISAHEHTRFKVISDGNPAILNCMFSEYAATIKIVTVHFNSTVCNDSDEDILKEVSNLCHNKDKREFELSDLIKDHTSTCSSNESTAQLGIAYHCSYPFTMQYLEGDKAILNCTGEYKETIQISSVLYNYSTCSHGDQYGIQNLCDGHTTCRFDVTNSNVGSICGADGQASLQVSYNCKRNGGWSNWTRNSSCSVTCGGGTQLYTRSCTNPSPNEIGASCVGESYHVEACNVNNCSNCGNQKFYDRQSSCLQLKTDSSNGTGYLLIDPVNSVHCCGQITLWHYMPVKSGTITFSVWRKTPVNRYKVVGTNTVVINATDINKQSTYSVPENETTLINTGDIIGWHDGGQNIIGYYDCLPSKKPCPPTTTLRNNMDSTNLGDKINTESLPQESSRIYTISYTSTVKGPPTFGNTADSVTIGDHKSVNSRVMNIQITDFGDFIQKMELDYDNEYFYFDTRLGSIFVKKMLPQKRTIHNYVLSVQDWCSNTATLNVTIVTQNIPPVIHGLPDMLRINPININPNLTTFSVDDPSDNVTCMINKTTSHTDMFILSLHGNDASLVLCENSSIDVNTNSEYVITISCTDGEDTTFVDLTLLFTTDKPDPQSDTTPIIIGASIGGLFLLVVIIVIVCVIKRQHKNNDKKRENKTVQSSHIGSSSDGDIPNRNSMAKEFDVISHDDFGYAEVRKFGNVDIAELKTQNVEQQPSTSEGIEYQALE